MSLTKSNTVDIAIALSVLRPKNERRNANVVSLAPIPCIDIGSETTRIKDVKIKLAVIKSSGKSNSFAVRIKEYIVIR